METRIEYINGEACAVGVGVISDNEVRELRDYAVANRIPLQVAHKRVGVKFVRCAMDENGKIVTLGSGQVYRLFEKQPEVEEIAPLETACADESEVCAETEQVTEETETAVVDETTASNEEPQEAEEIAEEVETDGETLTEPTEDDIYCKALESRIEDLCGKLDAEKEKVAQLTKENFELQGMLSDTDGTIAELNVRIAELGFDIEQAQAENTKLVDQINQLLASEGKEEEVVDELVEVADEPIELQHFDELEISLENALDILRAHGIKSISLD